MGSPRTLRIALAGLPGAGKSTTAAVLTSELRESGRTPEVVKLAAPLYDVQSAFYARAGISLADGRQDGQLLNFLGGHFREIDPEFLLNDFAERCAGAIIGGADVIVCDDARPVDLKPLAGQGFAIVEVTASDAVRRLRKSGRDDLRAGSDTHPTETGTIVSDQVLDNSGDLAALRKNVNDLLATLTATRSDHVQPKVLIDMLVGRAEQAVAARYAENRHQIGAVLLTASGRVFTGLHVEAMVGRASVCAEAVALGKACEAGATDLRVGVAVRHAKPSETGPRSRVVPPCGLCRELLLDYAPGIRVVVPSGDALQLTPLAELLPHKYVGTKWSVR